MYNNKKISIDKNLAEQVIIKNLFLLGDDNTYKYGVMVVNARFYTSTLKEENIFKKLIEIFTHALQISHVKYQKKQIIVIANMEKLTFSNINSSFLKKMVKILQDTYPERLYKCYIHNPPFIFSYIYKIIRPFLDKRTTSKMKFISKNTSIFNQNGMSDIDEIEFIGEEKINDKNLIEEVYI